MEIKDLKDGVWLRHKEAKWLRKVSAVQISSVRLWRPNGKLCSTTIYSILDQCELWRTDIKDMVIGNDWHRKDRIFEISEIEDRPSGIVYFCDGGENGFYLHELEPYIENPVVEQEVATGICHKDENGNIKMPSLNFQPKSVMLIPISDPEFKVGDWVEVDHRWRLGSDFDKCEAWTGQITGVADFVCADFMVMPDTSKGLGRRFARIRDMKHIPKESVRGRSITGLLLDEAAYISRKVFKISDDRHPAESIQGIKSMTLDELRDVLRHPPRHFSPGDEHRVRIHIKELEGEAAFQYRKSCRWDKEFKRFVSIGEDHIAAAMLKGEKTIEDRMNRGAEYWIDFKHQYDPTEIRNKVIEQNRKDFWNGRVGSM